MTDDTTRRVQPVSDGQAPVGADNGTKAGSNAGSGGRSKKEAGDVAGVRAGKPQRDKRPRTHPWRAWSPGQLKGSPNDPVRMDSYGYVPSRRYSSFGSANND